MHSFIILRHGKTLAEGYWDPYNETSLQRMYSATKSFTSVAIGFLEKDGLISLDDPIVRYFPDKVFLAPSEYTRSMTIRDMLKMSSVHTHTAAPQTSRQDHTDAFLNFKPSHRSGTVFNYDSGATVVLSALIERLTGMPMLEYLRKKALDWIGFSKEAHILPIEGVSHGASGMLCTTRDLARFALFCMGGSISIRQYLEQATSRQIDTSLAHHGFSSYGYGYQFWRAPHNSFLINGMCSQLALCIPDEDLILITTADTCEMPGDSGTAAILNAFWETVYVDAVQYKGHPLPADPDMNTLLSERLSALQIAPVYGSDYSELARIVSGHEFELDKNESVFRRVSVSFGPNYGLIEYMKADGRYCQIRFGFNSYLQQYFEDNGSLCMASGAWTDEHTLFVRVFDLGEELGALHLLLHFADDGSLTFQAFPMCDFVPKSYSVCVTGYSYHG